MPIKRSVVEIDVKDERFKSFMASYQKYQTTLQKTPGAWAAVNSTNKDQLKTMQMMTAALLAQADVMRRVSSAQSESSNKASKMADAWKSIAQYTKDSGRHLQDNVTRLMRWTGITSALGGLTTGASVWGLERLAQSAGAGRRSSMGLGATYGQQSAFGLTYNRVIDAPGFMGSISTARGNIASGSAASLYALGMNPMGGGNTGDMANEALARIRVLAQKTPESQLGIAVQSHMLGEHGIGVEDMRRLKTMSDQEFESYRKQYSKNAGDLNVGDKTLKAYQDFDNILEQAGQKLKTSLIHGLVALQEPLTKLSDAFSDFLTRFLASDGFKGVIEGIAKGLNRFADYIGSPSFQKDMDTFVATIGQIAAGLVRALKWLSLIPGDSTSGSAPPMARDTPGHWLYKDRPDPTNPGFTALPPSPVKASAVQNNQSPGNMGWTGIKDFVTNMPWMPSMGRNPWKGGGESVKHDELVQKLMAKGWSEEQARGIAANIMAESGGRTDIPGDGGQAYGLAQWHPDRQAMFKKVFKKDIRGSSADDQIAFIDWELRNSEAAAGMRLARSQERGDAAAIVSRYYERPLAVDEAARNRAASARGQGAGTAPITGTRIVIENNTGGNANVSTSQMGIIPQ